MTFLRDPNDGAERSRWRAGVNTFGPVGRIAVTLVVLAFAPWTTNVVALAVVWPAYLVIAAIVLHATWKKDDVVRTTIAEIADRGRRATPKPTPQERSGALRSRRRG